MNQDSPQSIDQKNAHMARTLAIGDIHGCLTVLQTLLEFVEVTDDDFLITLGDYVDRGPDSAGVLDWVVERTEMGQLAPLLGNHEIMMRQAFNGGPELDAWLSVGGKDAVASYQRRGLSGDLIDIPESHRKLLFLDGLNYFETETHFFVHANALSDCDLADQPEFMLFWERWQGMRRHKSGKIMVCGHSALRDGWPAHDPNSVCIDTRVYGDTGWLTCLDIRTNEFWQANHKGETRYGWLDEIDYS